jgi:hypothetical protein
VVALVARGEHRFNRGDPRADADLKAALAADPEARLYSTRRARELLGGRVAA